MTVHNLSRESMQPGDVYVGRKPGARWARLIPPEADGADGYFGNPYPIGDYGDRADVVRLFEVRARELIAIDDELRDRVRALHGRRLFCWCSSPGDGIPCHGHVLERLAGELAGGEGHPAGAGISMEE